MPRSPFVSEDIKRLKALKVLILGSDLKLKGDAVIMAASLLHWYDSLEEKIQDALVEQSKVSAPKVKKIGD